MHSIPSSSNWKLEAYIFSINTLKTLGGDLPARLGHMLDWHGLENCLSVPAVLLTVTPASPRAHLPFLTLRFEGGLSFTALPAPTSSFSSSGKGLERSAMMSAMPMAVAATAASGFTFFPFFLRLEGARSLVPCPLPRSSFSTAESSAGSKGRRGVVAAGEPVADGGEPAVEGGLVESGVCPVGASTISLMCPNRMRACRGGRSLITNGVPASALPLRPQSGDMGAWAASP